MTTMNDFKPSKPTHRIKAKLPAGKGSTIVGSAWANVDGSISIKLHPGVVLRWDDGLLLTAFVDGAPPRRRGAPTMPAGAPGIPPAPAGERPATDDPNGFYDDDLPF